MRGENEFERQCPGTVRMPSNEARHAPDSSIIRDNRGARKIAQEKAGTEVPAEYDSDDKDGRCRIGATLPLCAARNRCCDVIDQQMRNPPHSRRNAANS
jgi:hypothetical protein